MSSLTIFSIRLQDPVESPSPFSAVCLVMSVSGTKRGLRGLPTWILLVPRLCVTPSPGTETQGLKGLLKQTPRVVAVMKDSEQAQST